MTVLMKLLRSGFVAFLILSVLGGILALGIYLFLEPGLPSVTALKDVQLQTPLRVYSQEGDLLAEYGEKRRKPLRLGQIPQSMQQAFLAAEDDRFFKHPGVDYQGLLRAAAHIIRTGEKGPGGSTITMQLARNFFLTRERTYSRKLKEIFLALKIERELSKHEILELYLNKIYFGHRAYGVGAAAEVYYGTPVDELSLDQIAMIAGLPKAPSTFNPIANPDRALLRRNYVLGRMRDLEFIDEQVYAATITAPITALVHSPVVAVNAPYIGEMARDEIFARFGPDAYTRGYRVYTTVKSKLQRAANNALRTALLAYEERHGYRGPEARIETNDLDDQSTWSGRLANYRSVGGLQAALVVKTDDKHAQVYVRNGDTKTLDWDGLDWARPYINENRMGPKPESAADILSPGDIIRIRQTEAEKWRLAQIPSVSGALVSLDPKDGSVIALIGGFDFYLSKFNRVTQAQRQPGSNFKPFIYSAALEKDFTPASIINDAPVVFNDTSLEDMWRPENYSGKFFGPTRLRVALTKSRNLVSIRLLNNMGKQHAMDHILKFGFDRERLPLDLSLALGSGTMTPLEIASGYAVFANGGFQVAPYFIQHIKTADGNVVYQANPQIVCAAPCAASDEKTATTDPVPDVDSEIAGTSEIQQRITPATRIITAHTAYQMVSMMKDVIRFGTGKRAMALKRSDLAGKTGTTNDQMDAWFSGYNSEVVATVWVGFDQLKTLGNRETGAAAALPMWIDYMRVALEGMPEHTMKQPHGMVTVRIDPKTGLLADADHANAIFETFRADRVPTRTSLGSGQVSGSTYQQPVELPEQLF